MTEPYYYKISSYGGVGGVWTLLQLKRKPYCSQTTVKYAAGVFKHSHLICLSTFFLMTYDESFWAGAIMKTHYDYQYILYIIESARLDL